MNAIADLRRRAAACDIARRELMAAGHMAGGSAMLYDAAATKEWRANRLREQADEMAIAAGGQLAAEVHARRAAAAAQRVADEAATAAQRAADEAAAARAADEAAAEQQRQNADCLASWRRYCGLPDAPEAEVWAARRAVLGC